MLLEREEFGFLTIDAEPIQVMFTSEPEVVYTARGYAAVAKVYAKKRRQELLLFIGAASLTRQLHGIVVENGGRFIGIEVWLRKENYDKSSKYIVEQV